MNDKILRGKGARVGAWRLAELIILAAAGLCAMPAMGQGNTYQPNWYKSYGPVWLLNRQTLTLPTTQLADTVRPGSGESVWISIMSTNASVTNVTAKFDVSPDGVNWTTTAPFKMVTAISTAAGNNTVMDFTNWPANGSGPTLNNARKLACTSLVNGDTNSVRVTVWVSHVNQ